MVLWRVHSDEAKQKHDSKHYAHTMHFLWCRTFLGIPFIW